MAERDQSVAAVAQSGAHHLSDEIWNDLSGSLFDNAPKYLIDRRTLINGMLCLLVTGASTTSLPAVYGDKETFLREAHRFVYSGEWDAFVDFAQQRYPDIVARGNLGRFRSARWPRSDCSRGLALKPDAIDKDVVNGLIAKSTDAYEIRRLKIALGYADGKKQVAMANDLGVEASYISGVVRKLKRHGLDALLCKSKAQITAAKSRLTDEQREKVFELARGGKHPHELRGINLADLIQHCQTNYGVTYTRGGMLTVIRTQGIKLKESNKHAFRKLNDAQQEAQLKIPKKAVRKPPALLLPGSAARS